MNHDAVLVRFLGADLLAHGAISLPSPPRVPSFGNARALHTPAAGVPALSATVAPRSAS